MFLSVHSVVMDCVLCARLCVGRHFPVGSTNVPLLVIKVLSTSVCVCVCVELTTGRCYPCIATVSVSCVCGSSSISVPCGQERATQVPSCEEPCTLPSCCLHPHTCHPPPCPPCTKPCGNSLDCGHTCKAVCHSTPKPKVA